jgi:hypothetical protein
MTKAYILIYNADTGSQVDGNVAYSTVEVFDDAEMRDARINYIIENVDYDVIFRTDDVDVMIEYDFEIPERSKSDDTDQSDEFDQTEGNNPRDYYFHVFEDFFELNDDGDIDDEDDLEEDVNDIEDAESVTIVLITPSKYFDETGTAWNDPVPLKLKDRFIELGHCEYEYEGTVAQARAELFSMGFRESVAFSRMIQNYLDDPDA